MVCSFKGSNGEWPAFSFSNYQDYTGGRIVIRMRAARPNQDVYILTFDRSGNYKVRFNFKATSYYADYTYDIPEDGTYYRFAIQEGSGNDNTFYIKSILYYPKDYSGNNNNNYNNNNNNNYYSNQSVAIVDGNGLHWEDASWGNTNCNFQYYNGMVCSFVGEMNEYPAFSFKTDNSFKKGTLVINMKVLKPDLDVHLMAYDVNENYYSIKSFKATSYYADYTFDIPALSNSLSYYRFAIQEISNQDNTFYIKSVTFYPQDAQVPKTTTTTTVSKTPTPSVTYLDHPDAIIDGSGLHWEDASWGRTSCRFQRSNGMVCSFVGENNAWPAFSFKTNNHYNKGTLVINMKVSNPDLSINILAYDLNDNYYSIGNFKATTEYEDYTIEVPARINSLIYRFAIQEVSNQDNTYYIKSVTYYPPNVKVPTTTKKTTTTTAKRTTTTTTTTTTKRTTKRTTTTTTTTTVSKTPTPTVTYLDHADVIIDESGLHWEDASWGRTSCRFQRSNGMVCSFVGENNAWPAFSFKTDNHYSKGTLVINMKVSNPDLLINILAYDINENYYSIGNFRATTEYEDYTIEVPARINSLIYRFAIQEVSNQDNTYYIKKI
ncbi:hypothetical protein H8356DRAFT_1751806, partial [Neocallimastix lanati (nom. inval.)]